MANFHSQKSKLSFTKELRFFTNIKAKEAVESYFQSAWHDKIFWTMVLVWFVPLLITALISLIAIRSLPQEIPLFYSRLWGETQLAARNFLLLPVGGAFLLGIFNFGLAANFHSHDKITSYLLSGTAAVIALLAAITSLNIINLVR